MHFKPHHVGIIVSDLGASTAFYRSLGFETSLDLPWEDGSRAIRFMRNGDLEIELFWYADSIAPPAEGKRLGFRHLAFRVDDVDAALDELKAAGIAPADAEAKDTGMGFKIAFLADPDGLEIELAELT